MTTDELFWLSGLSLAIGGLLNLLSWILFAIFDSGHQFSQHSRWFPLNLHVIFGGLLMAIGLPGFYASQASESGI
jgi:hypothetical protein